MSITFSGPVDSFRAAWNAVGGKSKVIVLDRQDVPAMLHAIDDLAGIREVVAVHLVGVREERKRLQGLERLPSLHALLLAFRRVSSEDLLRLCEGGSSRRLRKLSVQADTAGDEVLSFLAARPPCFPEIRSIALPSTRLSDRGLNSLLGCELAGNLRELDLSYNSHLSDTSAMRLLTDGALPALRSLSLQALPVSVAGVAAALAQPAARRLENLSIASTCYSERGIASALLALLAHGSLQRLDVSGCLFSASERSQLVALAAERACVIEFDGGP